MIHGPNTIANMVLGSARLAVKTMAVMTHHSHPHQGDLMKKTLVALLTLLGLVVAVKTVTNIIES